MKKIIWMGLFGLVFASCNKESYILGYGTTSSPLSNDSSKSNSNNGSNNNGNGTQNIASFSATVNGVDPGSWTILSETGDPNTLGFEVSGSIKIFIYSYFSSDVVGTMDLYSGGDPTISVDNTSGYYSTYYNQIGNSNYGYLNGKLNITSINQNSKIVSGTFSCTCYEITSASYILVSGTFTNITWTN